MSTTTHWALFLALVAAAALQHHQIHAQASSSLEYPTATLNTKWTNGLNAPHTVPFNDGTKVTSILLRRNPAAFGPTFACGFFCGGGGARCQDGYLFGVFTVYSNSGGGITGVMTGMPQMVWSANRNRLVREGATAHFTKDGDLVLRDSDGSLVWSTGTANRKVAEISITNTGNLVLLDKNGNAVWQSFDHPTDAIVPGQRLVEGQTLRANVSASEWGEGEVSLVATAEGLKAYVGSNPPQLYKTLKLRDLEKPGPGGLTYARSPKDGKLYFYLTSSDTGRQFMRLEHDGHLRIYGWGDLGSGWQRKADLLVLDRCAFPTACGHYGICSSGQCSCPRQEGGRKAYFRMVNATQPSLGCYPVTPLQCRASRTHKLLALPGVSYFNFPEKTFLAPRLKNLQSCRDACLRSCSCKAAFFQSGKGAFAGSCYLVNEVFSLMKNQPGFNQYNSAAFIKVQG